jgi:hypothetical protein
LTHYLIDLDENFQRVELVPFKHCLSRRLTVD